LHSEKKGPRGNGHPLEDLELDCPPKRGKKTKERKRGGKKRNPGPTKIVDRKKNRATHRMTHACSEKGKKEKGGREKCAIDNSFQRN